MDKSLKCSGIYCIEHATSGKYYIGQAVDVWVRFLEHKRDLKSNIHDNKHLQNAWNKYGETDFKFYLILKSERANLTFLEDYFLEMVPKNKRYNIAPIYKNTMYTAWNKNKSGCFSDETRNKMSKSHKGQKAWNCGIQLSSDHVYNLKLAHSKNPIKGTNASSGEVKKYLSAENAKHSGFSPTKIRKCLRGEQKFHKGFYWEYSN